MSHHRQEAITLAKASNALKATLYQHEYTVEQQTKELATLHVEQSGLKEALSQAWREKEDLLRRWMEEKKQEADRLNKYNDAQERYAQRRAPDGFPQTHRGRFSAGGSVWPGT